MESAKIKRETLILSSAVVFLSDPILLKLFYYFHLTHLSAVGMTRIVQTLAILWIVIVFEKNFTSVGLSGKQFFHGITRGVAWSISFAIVAAIAFGVLKLFKINPFLMFKTRLPFQFHDKVLFFIIGGLVAPLAEEVFFRGVIFGFLRKWGFPFALFMSTGIFVSFHILFSGVKYPIAQIVGGFIFAISYETEKSLWVPIIIHAAGNMAIFSLSLL